MSDDWAAVESALAHAPPTTEVRRAFLALSRLREREAQMQEKGLEWLKAIQLSEDRRDAAEARVAEYDALWAKDNTCGICPYRMKIQARVARLEDALREIAQNNSAFSGKVARRALVHEGEKL